MSQKVDIKEIMKEIKKKADERREKKSLTVEFQPIPKNKIDYKEIEEIIENYEPKEYEELCVNSEIVLERPVTGNAIVRFIRRLQKKLTRFYIAPVVFEQNHFNDEILYAVNSLRIGEADALKKIHETQSKIYEILQIKTEDSEIAALKHFVYQDILKENIRLQKQCEEIFNENQMLKEKVEKIEACLSALSK